MNRKKAVALKYNKNKEKNSAPVVIAKGAGHIANKIVELAEEAGVYIHEDRDLVEVLGGLEIGVEIPEELYETVAVVLAQVYKMNKEYGEKNSSNKI